MKLIVYDAAWISHLGYLVRAMRTDWDVRTGSNNLPWLQKEIVDADALLALRLPPEAKLMARHLRLLLIPGAGITHIDSQELPAGCSLCNVYEHEVPVAEYVLMVALMHATKIIEDSASFRQGHWTGSGRVGGEPHRELFGKTMGLIGFGHIGQSVAVRARAFGMRIIALTRNTEQVYGTTAAPDCIFGPDESYRFFSSCDFIVAACSLNETSRGMIGANEIEMMRQSAVLINVSRAEVFQERPLYEALRDGRIAGAALDVWYQYPSCRDDTLHGSRLQFHELPNVLATPHFSAWTEEMIQRRCHKMAENLDRLALGNELERIVMIGSWRWNSRETSRDQSIL